MKFAISLFALAATAVVAFPSPAEGECSPSCPNPPAKCPPITLDEATARKIAETYLYFFINIDRTLAFQTLADNFTLYSDSDNAAGITTPNAAVPSGTPEFTNAIDFIKAQPTAQFIAVGAGVTPVPNPYIVLDVFNSCNKITVRWLLQKPNTLDSLTTDIRGIDVLELAQGTDCEWEIQTAYSEFNSLTFVRSEGKCDSLCTNIIQNPTVPGAVPPVAGSPVEVPPVAVPPVTVPPVAVPPVVAPVAVPPVAVPPVAVPPVEVPPVAAPVAAPVVGILKNNL